MEYLAITVMGSDQKILVSELFLLVTKNHCSIKDSRLTTLGKEFAAILLVAGNWNAIAKLETGISALNNREDLGLTLHYKRTELAKYTENFLPYLVQVVALDNPDTVTDISDFFISQNIIINDLQTNPFNANYSNTAMLTLMLSISIPVATNIADLRERFMLLCDELNIDGILEPEKR